VQHGFWKHQEQQKTPLTIADKIAQFYADLLFKLKFSVFLGGR
jgi:hypothetical protein